MAKKALVARCPTCSKPQVGDWAWCEPCLFCGKRICAEVVYINHGQESRTCYQLHTELEHPEVYGLPRQKAEGDP